MRLINKILSRVRDRLGIISPSEHFGKQANLLWIDKNGVMHIQEQAQGEEVAE